MLNRKFNESSVSKGNWYHCSILKIPKGILKNEEKTCKKASTCGGVAQLGEHLLCKQGVRSSILLISTKG